MFRHALYRCVPVVLCGQPAPDREFPELTRILKECDKVMEKVSPESLKDLTLIAAEFDNVERRKEVELVLGDYMAGVIMERQGVESEENLRDILKQYATCPSWLAL